MWQEEHGPAPEDVSAAALVSAPFVLVLAGVQLARPYTPEQLARADPIVQTVGGAAPWIVVGLGVLVVLVWCGRWRPEREHLRRAGRWALVGAAAAALVAGGLRLAVGPELPGFIPPEESAKPGVALGLSAGMLEEQLFRFAILPAGFVLLRKKLAWRPAVVGSALIAAALFVLGHELPPAGGGFALGHTVTRFLFPGLVMSLAFWLVSPAFLVTAHLTGHLLIPALFA